MNRRNMLQATSAAAGALVTTQMVSAGTEADLTSGFVVRSSAGRYGEKTLIFGGSPNDIKVSGGDTGGRLAVFEYTGRTPGGPPMHVHPDQDEIFFIQGGEFLFEVGGVRRKLAAGDTIFLPRKVPHTFAQLGSEGRMVFMFTPAGSMETFFRSLAKARGPMPSDLEAALFAAHGMRIVGPGLAVARPPGSPPAP